MKKDRIIFWLATSVIIFVEGIGTVMTFNEQYAKDIVYNLGYPEYFRVAMAAFKLIGVIIIVTPRIPFWIKEWAYAGFFINTCFAIISYLSVYGWGTGILFPLFVMVSLLVSHQYHQKKYNQTSNV